MKKAYAVLMCALLIAALTGCKTVRVVETSPSAEATPTSAASPVSESTPETSTPPEQEPEATTAAPSENVAAGTYKPGTYEVTVRGMGGKFKVEVTFDAESIVSIKALDNLETENIGTRAIEEVIPAMIEAQSPDVDAYSGATITSNALKSALTQAIELATP